VRIVQFLGKFPTVDDFQAVFVRIQQREAVQEELQFVPLWRLMQTPNYTERTC